ncbi:MAG: CAP domain-containing protein [Patescibacteria group bacterium]|jgi:hypothetical protein|nr:CAP domain-containing protein [Candidatus Moranbacteria bacterium]
MLEKIKEFIKKHKKLVITEIGIYILALIVFFAPVALASSISVENVKRLVNEARASINIIALKENAMLKRAAEEKAQDMIDKNYFAHVSPEEKDPWYWIKQSGYDYRFAGENLAMNFTNAEDEHNAWMESESHRKNILNPNYDEIGVAVKEGVLNGRKTILVVQMFGKQMNPVSSSEENAVGIAGLQTSESDGSNAKSSEGKSSFQQLVKENKKTLTGWLFAFALALVIIFIDVMALMHKKHKPLFFSHQE